METRAGLTGAPPGDLVPSLLWPLRLDMMKALADVSLPARGQTSGWCCPDQLRSLLVKPGVERYVRDHQAHRPVELWCR